MWTKQKYKTLFNFNRRVTKTWNLESYWQDKKQDNKQKVFVLREYVIYW